MTELGGDYKATLNLPQTDFAMRANAAVREPEIQAFWQQEQIPQTFDPNAPAFVLHDGPPYANGDIHMGTTLNKILKDIINKFYRLRGYRTPYVPGWDCHGLPIELKVLQEIPAEIRQNLTPIELRQRAKAYALDAVARQKRSFQRCGVWGDWDNAYLTLDPEYEAAQIDVFGQMALKGYIYRGLKPVHWSPSSRTALAEAELEYPDGHVSPSIYALMRLTELTPPARAVLGEWDELYLAIWTTTPWTLPGNLAVAVHPEITYAVVISDSQGPVIVAADLVNKWRDVVAQEVTVARTFPGKILEFCHYQHPLFDRQGVVVLGEHVTVESGTGLVHTAPGHGTEDYAVGQKYGLPLLSPVDDAGCFTQEAGAFAGLPVLKEGNQAIIEALRQKNLLVKHEPYQHKYPYDWRTKKPTIFRATAQWFASVSGFRELALQAIRQVQWIPPQGENRITAMVQERTDWCISRQRAWGVPIPVFYDVETDEPLLNAETIAHVRDLIRQHGSDIWWTLPVEELLPPTYRQNGRTYRKGMDTMDVWFDSGSSWAAVLQARGLADQADLYLEGSDQHRGWFQSSLLTSVAVRGKAPYKQVLTHGFVLDEQGRKMSKSLGNVVDPLVVINGGKNPQKEPAYGADVLRLWVASVNYADDVPLGNTILNQMADVYRKIRNTARFLLGNLYDFDPQEHAIPYANLPQLDRYLLHRLSAVVQTVTQAFQDYEFYHFFQTVQNFCVVDLSSFYLDIAKDRLYISAANSYRRRSCQTVLAIAVETLAKLIAPVLSHLAEDIWQFIPYKTGVKSVFLTRWPEPPSLWHQPELARTWDQWRDLRADVNKVLEAARVAKTIGSSLEAQIILQVGEPELLTQLQALNTPTNGVDELRYLLLVSQVTVQAGEPGQRWTVAMQPAAGKKCARCWNYSEQVGQDPQYPDICERCVQALAGQF
ncbi:MAG: isoleucine--tRNA ligase [Gloeomargarita sp. SKYG116]|nr:isoleucine--tRNA ligase [Gloeomargarita sp. SKYG116]MDW8400973.1 isoleucine--tRNA ligase [Gloeomargarita sp. SKYGB_i_bin116]